MRAGHHRRLRGIAAFAASEDISQLVDFDGAARFLGPAHEEIAPDPIQVGETTTYTIRITNQGNADLTNINTVAQYAKEVTPVSSQGGAVDGKTVKFPTIPRLGAKQSVTYTITGKGAAEGDHRLKLVVTEDQLLSPVVEEESTRVY